MTEAPGEFHLNRRVRRPATNPFADLLDGPLQESLLRICVAVGDSRKAHLRRVAVTMVVGETVTTHYCEPTPRVALCGRVHAPFADETAEATAAGGRKACSGCLKRASPGERTSALCRATQLVARKTMTGRSKS